ncbi:MAG: helix-turn-helix domain-containing protein [bacterium]|nr:helix-turn-helix domain-containing protein [bacterium]
MRTVVLPIESSRSSGRQLLRGVARYSRLHGPWRFYWEPGGLDEIVPRLKELKADGIITRDSSRLPNLLQFGIPTVIIEHHFERNPEQTVIYTDSTTIGEMAADHLASCGFRHFAFCGYSDKPWSIARRHSFVARLNQQALFTNVFESPTAIDHFSSAGEQQRLASWLKTLPKPVGVMACNDDRGQQVLSAVQLAGLKTPDDVALIGVDNDELICEFSDPPMSSVALNFERGGFEGAALLDRLMNGESPDVTEVIVQPTHPVVRQSTDIMVLEDAAVVDSLRFIRMNAVQNICVSDVVEAGSLSRRALEKRFRDQLNRSILEEIRRARTKQISSLLIETDMSITQIAIELRFQSEEHISRYFKREMKMTPREFRKTYGRKASK